VRTTPLRGTAGQPIAPAIELRATDRAGNPVPGVTITLRPTTGTVGQREVVTDSTGRVAVTWTLGPASGVQRLTASAADVERSVEVSAQVRAGPAAKIALEGLPAMALGGEPLPHSVDVVVTDAYGNAVAGVPVAFASKAGKVTLARARTDQAGRASTRWTLGTAAGEQRIEAMVKEAGIRASGVVRATAPARRKR